MLKCTITYEGSSLFWYLPEMDGFRGAGQVMTHHGRQLGDAHFQISHVQLGTSQRAFLDRLLLLLKMLFV